MSVYVAVAKPGCERRAMRWLLEKGLPAYAPMSRVFRRVGHMKVKFDLPIIQQYVLVVMADDDEAAAVLVRRCRYVIRLDGTRFDALRPCRRGGAGSFVDPMDWLTSVLIWQSFGLLDKTLVRRPSFRIGQLVRIIQGSFQGCIGTVVAETPAGKAEVSIEGRFIHGKVKVDPAGLVDIDPKAA